MADYRDVLEGRARWAMSFGNCLDVMAEMPDASVDAIVTDPPYFLPAKHYSTRTRWARSVADLSIIESFLRSVVEQSRRVLAPKGAFVCFCDGQSYPVLYVAAYRLFDRITDVVWDKGAIGMGVGVRRQHELILVGVPDSFGWNGWTPSVVTAQPVRSEARAVA